MQDASLLPCGKPSFVRNRIYLNFQELDNKTAEIFLKKTIH